LSHWPIFLKTKKAGGLTTRLYLFVKKYYSIIFETTPAPTVLPPSRIANFKPCSIATGAISSTVMLTLSPGITISVPEGNVAAPVTSVVLK